MTLTDPVRIGGLQAPNRLLFGPHETNLAHGRSISPRHVAYYARRSAGGAGIIVTEEASVHESDWPYERAPLAAECGPGWAAVAEACRDAGNGTLLIAALGHAGGQGSSAYSQAPLWAPSRVPEVNSREVPKWMESDDITAVTDGFAAATRLALRSGMHGVEVNAGQNSLVRQFLSGLTNQRDDHWGTDRLAFARAVLEAVRGEAGRLGSGAIVGLRLSCDELAPWAGLTPEMAADVAVALAPLIDYLVVVRGSIFTVSATRPDFHETPGFNRELCATIRAALRNAGSNIPVVLQGSVIDPLMADQALTDGACDLVEMTRAQIADPTLGAKVAAGRSDAIRPCVLCNQLCLVRDARNPIVSCAVEPSSGHELDDPSPVSDGQAVSPSATSRTGRPVLVVGGGPAGLEAARSAALMGHPVRIVESGASLARRLRFPVARSGNTNWSRLADWLEAECRRLDVRIDTDTNGDVDLVRHAVADGATPIFATGSRDGAAAWVSDAAANAKIISAADLAGHWADLEPGSPAALPGEDDAGDAPHRLVVLDPIGGPIGVALAEALASRSGATVHLVTQDHLAGNELARTGDLAPANVRLQQAGVIIERRCIPRSVGAPDDDGRLPVVLEDRFTGEQRTLEASFVIDAGFRLPDEALWLDSGAVDARAGDCVAPRTVHEAILEGRRAAVAVHEGQLA